MVLNSLRANRIKFNAEWGELVLCCDNRTYWRREVFPYYKAHRKKAREKSGLNWPLIFECLNTVKSDLREYFPYKIIDVEGAEADDVIATLCLEARNYLTGLSDNPLPEEKILILSGDKDFIQLHRNGIKQYDPVQKKWVTHPNPATYLKEHILKGDAGDGIPNVRSLDNTFVTGQRQKPVTGKMIEEYNRTLDKEHRLYRNYLRNRQLIELTYTPVDIKNDILNQYFNSIDKGRTKLFPYFMNHNLKQLMTNIGDF